jgi:lipoate-protein ligase A
MAVPSGRLLSFEVADGPSNMAADQVLLEAAEQGQACMRLYGWSTPTLSLGYFQPEAARWSDPQLAALPWVRRATGGEALVHHFELTYTLALPPGLPWQKGDESWICHMHDILRAALSSLGVSWRGCGHEETKRLGAFLCFLHQTPGDVLLAGHKVIGSAQRKQRGALLQHGAILLASSPFTPSLPGIRDLCGIALTPQAVRAAMVEHFSRSTGWQLSEQDWTEAERRRRGELVEVRYASQVWNGKR